VWRDSFICVTWLIYMCDVTHLYVWHDSFICVTWLIMMHSYVVWHDSFICVTWLNHHTSRASSLLNPTAVKTQSWVAWQDSFMNRHDAFIYGVTWLIHICDMTQSSHAKSVLSATGWQRPIRCLVFIGFSPQKSPTISGSFAENDQLKESYGSLPPCNTHSSHDSFIRVRFLIMNHSYMVWHHLCMAHRHAFICGVAWLIHICGTHHSSFLWGGFGW